jgi:ribosomal protein S18 acetylase RimI-like enzyme
MSTPKTLTIPEAPDIPGLSFRYFRGAPDYAVIIDIFNACKACDGIEHSLSPESVAHHFEHLERSDPFTDMIFAEVDGEPIAYGRVGWYPESDDDHIYYMFGWVVPEWRRKGIGTAMLKHNERRLREIAADHPADAPKFYQVDHGDKQVSVAALVEKNGYEQVRWGYEMSRPTDAPLPDASLPDGLDVRTPTEEEHFEAIFWAQNEAFRDHWGHRENTEEDYQRWLSDPVTFQPDLWKVAWDGDEVAGMVLNFVNEEENREFERRRGYTEFISVRRPWRRQGVARSLLVQSIEMFRQMGMEETALGVDTLNPNHALNLYEGVGYQIDRKWTNWRKPLE